MPDDIAYLLLQSSQPWQRETLPRSEARSGVIVLIVGSRYRILTSPFAAGQSSQPRRARGEEITDRTDGFTDRELYTGLIRLHVLHHASEGPIYGLEMIEELRRHGYRLSPGTLYPLLHGLERKGYLIATDERNGSSTRRVYRATRSGKTALKVAKMKVRELFGELFEGAGSRPRQVPSAARSRARSLSRKAG